MEWVLIIYLAASPAPQQIPMPTYQACERKFAELDKTMKIARHFCIRRDHLLAIAERVQ
jgi:hypothetical protein